VNAHISYALLLLDRSSSSLISLQVGGISEQLDASQNTPLVLCIPKSLYQGSTSALCTPTALVIQQANGSPGSSRGDITTIGWTSAVQRSIAAVSWSVEQCHRQVTTGPKKHRTPILPGGQINTWRCIQAHKVHLCTNASELRSLGEGTELYCLASCEALVS